MNRGRPRVVIVGGSFGGVSAAYQLRRKLGDRVDLTLISAEPDFTFIPSSSTTLEPSPAASRTR